MRNNSDRTRRENQNTHFLSIFFSRKSCHSWDNVGGKMANTRRHMTR